MSKLVSVKLTHLPPDVTKQQIWEAVGPDIIHSLFLSHDRSHAFIKLFSNLEANLLFRRKVRIGHRIISTTPGTGFKLTEANNIMPPQPRKTTVTWQKMPPAFKQSDTVSYAQVLKKNQHTFSPTPQSVPLGAPKKATKIPSLEVANKGIQPDTLPEEAPSKAQKEAPFDASKKPVTETSKISTATSQPTQPLKEASTVEYVASLSKNAGVEPIPCKGDSVRSKSKESIGSHHEAVQSLETNSSVEDPPLPSKAKLKSKYLFIPEARKKQLSDDKEFYLAVTKVTSYSFRRDLETNNLKVEIVYTDETQFQCFQFIIESFPEKLTLVCRNLPLLKQRAKNLSLPITFHQSELHSSMSGSIHDINHLVWSTRSKLSCHSKVKQKKPQLITDDGFTVIKRSGKTSKTSLVFPSQKSLSKPELQVVTLRSSRAPANNSEEIPARASVSISEVKSKINEDLTILCEQQMPKIIGGGDSQDRENQSCSICQRTELNIVKKVCLSCNKPICVICLTMSFGDCTFNRLKQESYFCSASCLEKLEFGGSKRLYQSSSGVIMWEKNCTMRPMEEKDVSGHEENPMKRQKTSPCTASTPITEMFPNVTTFSGTININSNSDTECKRKHPFVEKSKMNMENGMDSPASKVSRSKIGQEKIFKVSEPTRKTDSNPQQQEVSEDSYPQQPEVSEDSNPQQPEVSDDANMDQTDGLKKSPTKEHISNFFLPDDMRRKNISKVINRHHTAQDKFDQETLNEMKKNKVKSKDGKWYVKDVDYHSVCRAILDPHNNHCTYNFRGCKFSPSNKVYTISAYCAKKECNLHAEFKIEEETGSFTFEFYLNRKDDPQNAHDTIEVTHNAGTFKTPHVRKKERVKIYSKIAKGSPIAFYLRQKSKLTKEQHLAGHTSMSKNTAQALKRESKTNHLPDQNLFESLHKLSLSNNGNESYIKYKSDSPELRIVCMYKDIVDLALRIVESGGMLCCDGTGKVANNITGYKPLELFSFFVKNPNGELAPLRMLDCILSKKDKDELTRHCFEPLVKYIKEVFKTTLRPRVVMTDFSWPLLISAIEVFNNETPLQYLKRWFDILKGVLQALENIHDKTFFAQCCTHYLRNMRGNIKKSSMNAKRKHMTLVFFSTIAAMASLEEYHCVLENLMVLLYSKKFTTRVKQAHNFLLSERNKIKQKYNLTKTSFDNPEVIINPSAKEDDGVSSAKQAKNENPMKDSPFKQAALEIKEAVLKQLTEGDGPENEYYCPSVMDYWLDFKSPWPGYTMMVHGNMERFGYVIKNNERRLLHNYESSFKAFFQNYNWQGLRSPLDCDSTNNTSELGFGIMKKTLQGSRRVDDLIIELGVNAWGHFADTNEKFAKQNYMSSQREFENDEQDCFPESSQEETWKKKIPRPKDVNQVIESAANNQFTLPLSMVPYHNANNNCWVASVLNFLNDTTIMRDLQFECLHRKGEGTEIPPLLEKIIEVLDWMRQNSSDKLENPKKKILSADKLLEIQVEFVLHKKLDLDPTAQQEAEPFLRSIFECLHGNSHINNKPIGFEPEITQFFHCHEEECLKISGNVPNEILKKEYRHMFLLNPAIDMQRQLEGWKNPKRADFKCGTCEGTNVWETNEVTKTYSTLILRVGRNSVQRQASYTVDNTSMKIERQIYITVEGKRIPFRYKSALCYWGHDASAHYYTLGMHENSDVLVKYSSDKIEVLKKNTKAYKQALGHVILLAYERIPDWNAKSLSTYIQENSKYFKEVSKNKSSMFNFKYDWSLRHFELNHKGHSDLELFLMALSTADGKKLFQVRLEGESPCPACFQGIYECTWDTVKLRALMPYECQDGFMMGELISEFVFEYRCHPPRTSHTLLDEVNCLIIYLPNFFPLICTLSEAEEACDNMNRLLSSMARIFPSVNRKSYVIDGFFDHQKGVMSFKNNSSYKQQNKRDPISNKTLSNIEESKYLFFLTTKTKLSGIPGLVPSTFSSFQDVLQSFHPEQNQWNVIDFTVSFISDGRVLNFSDSNEDQFTRLNRADVWLDDDIIDKAFMSIQKIFNLNFLYQINTGSINMQNFELPTPRNHHTYITSNLNVNPDIKQNPLCGVILVNGNHWIAYIYNPLRKMLLMYDPYGPAPVWTKDAVEKVYRSLCLLYHRYGLTLDEIKLVDLGSVPDIPIQKDQSSCGVFCFVILYSILAGFSPVEFAVMDAKTWMKKLIKTDNGDFTLGDPIM